MARRVLSKMGMEDETMGRKDGHPATDDAASVAWPDEARVTEVDALRMESSRLERELALSLFNIGFLAGVASHGKAIDESKLPEGRHLRAGWEAGRRVTQQAHELYEQLLSGRGGRS